ncbi:dephospho-CoA kinase [Pseudactinotalea sp. HY158]|uniref:dephospho-CoA kinase n=1 Tax=Pseudactinotalea sp. HY158 TaxID=2654547 RepID=UPI00129D1028|nr:dephospho-CoA kinase [Pseudactinotalea sp. HY158]QGH69208.1 dephospho-CoA kinase [Pseudactinotalea sp. HY158]
MIRIGLTGGIGAGKSTAARHFARLGAHLIDADVLAREVLDPGTPGLAAVVDRFGPGVLAPAEPGDDRGDAGGPDRLDRLDRPRLAAIVFDDAAALADLNSIVHPLVHRRTREELDRIARAEPDAVVVHDIPLLYEAGLAGQMDLVVVVSAEPQVRVERAVARGMDAADVRRRIAGQADDARRESIADVVLRNDGAEADLAEQVRAVWRERVLPLLAARA